ncbi:MBL fold metallo-hydrolase [Herbaspirillum sp. RTI4]|uniref:MBL fold metallo-hydrolase n=1 Tax=Herbaspirillum sp. RTI4 TaxID=3048640 RepID=UPI002AB4CA06|nr:MBL fold metallo-hydrolase [Herbaspirillum sp. RTI4]MDY7578057.1 MBL fold metallo-hydrolase [Herbaspirillum sp. RTI4]MEA9983187.1 MBL fold metallo-hydrolase [Herbaspirillum sp. RTI4]
MKFASLGSGSEGNALLISTTSGMTATTVMLDCGFGIRETERRLLRLGKTPADITGIVLTHEHSDHVGGAFKFARRHKIPVWLSYGTYQAVGEASKGVELHFCRDGDQLAIGGLEFFPYTVPHDAREPLQYAASDGVLKLGVLTDAGQATAHLIAALGACDALVLECNHDRKMLEDSVYPASLKRRIGGAYGHLSNDSSEAILRALDRSRLKMVIGAHLSQQNNTPELAGQALSRALQSTTVEVRIACQEQGFDWVAM